MDAVRTDLLPYEKFRILGPEALTDAELLAIAIRTGTPGKSPVELALEILESECTTKHDLRALMHLSIKELMEIPGIGEVKAIRLKSIAEISRRIARQGREERLDFSTPGKIASYFMEDMRHLEQEKALLLSLDAKGGLLGETFLSVGTIRNVLISPREVFLEAIRLQAVCIVLLHNHPSGDPTPSPEDRRLTRRLYEAGQLMEIPLADHIIIGELVYFSFREMELLRQ